MFYYCYSRIAFSNTLFVDIRERCADGNVQRKLADCHLELPVRSMMFGSWAAEMCADVGVFDVICPSGPLLYAYTGIQNGSDGITAQQATDWTGSCPVTSITMAK